MLAHFYFSGFRGGKLLTNDMGRYAFLTDAEFAQFTSGQLDPDSGKGRELLEKGFWYQGSFEQYIREYGEQYRDGSRYLFDATSLFIFAVTNECNHACVYCQANGENTPCRMTETVAEQALRRIAATPAREITIEFQGGEPLVNFPVIRFLVTRAPELMPDKRVSFSLVSNLSLMTPEIAAFLKEHGVSVSTSLDGPQTLHDRNRPMRGGQSAYALMRRGKAMLEAAGIPVSAIQTTTAASLAQPEAIVDAYVENGFRQIFLRPLTRLGAAARAWDTVGYSAEAYLAFYRRAFDRILALRREGIPFSEMYASLFLTKILRGRALNYMELRSPCGAGIGQIAITADGSVYTCDEGRMLAETGDHAFRLGNVFRDSYDEWMESPVCRAVCSSSVLETLPGCCDCVYKPYCGVCPVVNYALHGSMTHLSREKCQIHKGILDLLFNYLYDQDPDVLEMLQEWSDQV